MSVSHDNKGREQKKGLGDNLYLRLVSGALLSLISLYLIFLGTWPFVMEIFLLGGVALIEFYALIEKKGVRPLRGLGMLLTIAVFYSAYRGGEIGTVRFLLLGVLVVLTAVVFFRPTGRGRMLFEAASTILGVVYVGWLFSFLILLRDLKGYMWLMGWRVSAGAVWVTMLLVLNAFSDMGGYFVGRLWGRNRLLPAVSPRKTVEGALGAVGASMLAALGCGWVVGLSWWHSFVLGGLISVVAQLGDFWESALKREVGVKDSGFIVMGHGGILDRCDSLAFTTPVFYLYLVCFVL